MLSRFLLLLVFASPKALLASMQPIEPDQVRVDLLMTGAPKSPRPSEYAQGNVGLTMETRAYLAQVLRRSQAEKVIRQQEPIVKDLRRAKQMTEDGLERWVNETGFDLGLYSFPTDVADKKQVKTRIPYDSVFGRLTQETLLGYAKLADAVYFGSEERAKEIATGMTSDGKFPAVQPKKLEAWIHVRAPEFRGYEVKEVVTRHGTSQHSAAILYNPTDRHLIVAFVGTQSGADWLYNLRGLKSTGEFTNKVCGGLSLHTGFYELIKEQFKGVTRIVRRVIEEELGADEVLRSKIRVSTTGHSLGGAMSTLMAYSLKTAILLDCLITDARVENYSFASPRVFDSKSVKKVNGTLGKHNIVRVYNYSDIVPFVPCEFMGFLQDSLAFQHAGIEIRLRSPSFGGPLYHHGMQTYIELIGEQTPSLLVNLETLKKQSRQLVIISKHLNDLKEAKKDFEEGDEACLELVRSHRDRIEADLDLESKAIKKASEQWDMKASTVRSKSRGFFSNQASKLKFKFQKAKGFLSEYGQKIEGAKGMIPEFMAKLRKPEFTKRKKFGLKTSVRNGVERIRTGMVF